MNIAYTPEYLLVRESYEWLFETNGTSDDPIILGNGKYYAEVISYDQYRTENGLKRNYCGARISVRDEHGQIITDFKMIGENLVFLELIKHQNGKEYFIFRKDLYGYSVMDIESGVTVDYIPRKSFIPLGGVHMEEETFICCGAAYCKINNILAIDGCYWACPYDFEFYDFSNPMNLPFPLIGNAFDLVKRKGIDIVIDIRALDFAESGKCVFTIEKDGKPTKETLEIDVLEEFNFG
jgi:hypothetical protein